MLSKNKSVLFVSIKNIWRIQRRGAVQRFLFYLPDNVNKFLGKYYLSTLSQEENQEPNKKDIYKKPLANITLKSKTPKFPFELRKYKTPAVIPAL